MFVRQQHQSCTQTLTRQRSTLCHVYSYSCLRGLIRLVTAYKPDLCLKAVRACFHFLLSTPSFCCFSQSQLTVQVTYN